MAKTAIILGATGLSGSILLEKLLTDRRYEKVKLFSRRPTAINHEKIEEHLLDLFELQKMQDQFYADDVFCCIGSTKKKTPDETLYRKVDVGIPTEAARLAKKNGINTFIVVSALGADKHSRFFYNRLKGEMEEAILKFDIPNTYVLQPSLIMGERKEKRWFESVWKKLMKAADFLLIGSLKKYRSIHADTIATAMIYLANQKKSHTKSRIESDVIKRIAQKAGNFSI